MITWQGVADEIIPTNNSILYYSDIREQDSSIKDFYRLFLAPGVGHCGGGPGFYLVDALDALVLWVEKGVPPTQLSGVSPMTGRSLPICKYPLVAKWNGKDNSSSSSAYTREKTYE
jgi:hypothetical protein